MISSFPLIDPVVNVTNNITVNTDPLTLVFPYASYYDTTATQSSTALTPVAVSFAATAFTSGFTKTTNTTIKILNAGYYNLQFNAQFASAGAAGDTVQVWLKLNSVNGLTSVSILVPAKVGIIDGVYYLSTNFLFSAAVNDILEVWWMPTIGDAKITTIPAVVSPAVPVGPGATVNIQFVSAI